jgi:hypothetical protein
MKNLFIIVSILFSTFAFSQKDYPKIEKDSIGNQFVIMTLEQAQKVDNAFELLQLLEKSEAQCDSINLSYIKIIDNLERQIVLLESDVMLIKQQISDKDNQILNLQQRLTNCETDGKLTNDQILVRDNQINLLKNEISTLKTKRNIGYGVGIGGILLGIVLIILTN